MDPLPVDSPIGGYVAQAELLLDGYAAGNPEALEIIHHKHPRFLDPDIPWLPRDLTEADIRGAGFDLADAELTVARGYDFRDWPALEAHVAAVTEPGSPVHTFESAVEAVIDGDLEALQSYLRVHPDLVRRRSERVTHFDPPVHRATLLHYVAANGVEGYRQRTSANAVAVARSLLEAGAEPDALAYMYGGECTTMSMLVSSSPPAQAGVQVALVDVLADFGASIGSLGSGRWVSPLLTALVFGFIDAAQALVRRGARIDNLAAAAGLGRTADAERLLDGADGDTRHRALALAVQNGFVETVRLLLDAGEDPNRFNPEGFHAHAAPLHQAIAGGHFALVQLLLERGAKLDTADRIYKSTPLGWAQYLRRDEIAEHLRNVRSAT